MPSIKRTINTFYKNIFLFEQLVYRDFKFKYKGTVLGMLWSVLAPLLNLFVMKIIFTEFFGRNTPHYTIYLFAGNIVMTYYKEATKSGMTSLLSNSSILTKINVPKYMFLLTKNVSTLINFLLTVVVFFIFCIIDKITFSWTMLLMIYPIICLVLLNIGVGMILSCAHVFFRDMTYLYDIFLTLLNYTSAIFYTVDRFPENVQRLFLINPVYDIIKYIRIIVIDGTVPSIQFALLCLAYPLFFMLIGSLMYKKLNHRFVYYF